MGDKPPVNDMKSLHEKNNTLSGRELDKLLYDVPKSPKIPTEGDTEAATRAAIRKQEEIAKRIQIQKDYTIWKRYVPFLYDLVATHVLEWPSLTLQWFPEIDRTNPDFASCNILMGSNGNQMNAEGNYLILANVRLPPSTEDSQFHPSDGSLPLPPRTHTSKLETKYKIPMGHALNRARYMPQDCNRIACKQVQPDLLVYSLKSPPQVHQNRVIKKGSKRPRNHDSVGPLVELHPDLTLKGHRKEGYGLSWSPCLTGALLSGSDDGLICYWDTLSEGYGSRGKRNTDASRTVSTRQLDPVRTFDFHTSVVGDVQWHQTGSRPSVFGSVGDDGKLGLWDIRQQQPAHFETAHQGSINCIGFSPFDEHLVVSGGGSDRLVRVWDLRKQGRAVHEFAKHRGDVFNIQWNPVLPGVLATCSVDRRILVWDLTLTGSGQTAAEEKDGPPELLFVHSGHTDKVFDMAWHPDPEYCMYMVSAAEDNIVQVWSMNPGIYLHE